MNFVDALSQELGATFFAGKLVENRMDPGIFTIQLNGAIPSISVFTLDVNNNGINEVSYWNLVINEDNMKHHMEDDVGIYDELTTFSSYFCDALVSDIRVNRAPLYEPMTENVTQITLILLYTISKTMKLQGSLKLTLVQKGMHESVYHAMAALLSFNYEMQKAQITSRKSERKLPVQLRTQPKPIEVTNDGDGGATQAEKDDDVPVVQKAKIRKTGGVSIFPGRKK